MPKIRVVRHEVTQPLDKPYRLIPLTQGQNAIVDASDFEWLSKWNWCAQRDRIGFYAVRSWRKPNGSCVKRQMHNAVLKCNGQIDHKNHDTLDNRHENLRKCTTGQNHCNRRVQKNNTSGFKGVGFHKAGNKWRAQISINGKMKHLGCFVSPLQAAHAYDQAAKQFHKEFALLNFSV